MWNVLRLTHTWVGSFTTCLSIAFLLVGCSQQVKNQNKGTTPTTPASQTQSPTPSSAPITSNLSVLPLTQNFGSLVLGNTSSASTFTFSNTGTADATGCSAPTLSGANASEFAIQTDNCGTNDLTAGSNCTVLVTASPTTTGTKTATLSRTCTTGGVTSTTANGLQVVGTPNLVWNPLIASFGYVAVGTTSLTTQTFTLTNSGSANATGCSAPSLSNSTDFIIQTDNCGTANVTSGGGTCNVIVAARPQTTGVKTTTLSRVCTVGGTISTDANQITVTGNAPNATQSAITVTTNIAADGTATSTITITLKDASGNPVVNYDATQLTVAATGTSNTLVQPTGTTNSSGQVTATIKSTKAESKTISLSAPAGLTTVTTKTVTFIAASANKLSFSTQPSTTGNAGVNLSTQPVVKILDSNDNLIQATDPQAGATITLTAYTTSDCTTTTGTGTLSGGSIAASSGTATFTGVKYTKAESIYLKATSGTLTSACTNSIAISAGAVSASGSLVSPSTTTVAADGVTTATVTVTLKDAYGNLVSGKTVTLASSRGASDTISAASGASNASGVVTFTVSSTTLGAATFTATNTTDSNLFITPSAASITFVVGVADASTSTIAASPTSVHSDGVASATITITLKDGGNHPISGYDATTISITPATGGCYTTTQPTGTTNASGQVTATIKCNAATPPASTTISISTPVSINTTMTFVNSAPTIAGLADSTYPLDGSTPPLIQGNSATIATISDSDGDTFTSTCTYQSLGLNTSDPNYAPSGTLCTSLDTITSSGTPATTIKGKVSITNGIINWTPTATQRGTYQFTLNATDALGAASTQKVVTVTVRENTNIKTDGSTINLLSSWDALNATNASGLSASTASAPFASGTGNWLNLLTSGSSSAVSFVSANPWSGTGLASSPYRLTFGGTSDKLDLGSVLSGKSQLGLSVWYKPNSTTAGRIIAGNGGGTGNGFAFRNSTNPISRAEFVVGAKYYTYQDLILTHKPVAYWRLNETTGTTTVKDLSVTKMNGTYQGTYTLFQDSDLTPVDPTSKAILVTANNSGFETPAMTNNPLVFGGNKITIEAWMNRKDGTGVHNVVRVGSSSTIQYQMNWISSNGGGNANKIGFTLRTSTGSPVERYSTATISTGWHHIVCVYDGSLASGNLKIYIDGVPETLSTTLTANLYVPTLTSTFFRHDTAVDGAGSKSLTSEIAIYDSALTDAQITEHYNVGKTAYYKTYPGNAVLADNPIGYWRLGETSGGIAYDYTSNSNNATYTSRVVYGQTGALDSLGDKDTSVTLTGSPSRISIVSALTTGSTDFTLEAWIKPTTSGTRREIISYGTDGTSSSDGTNKGVWFYLNTSNKVQFDLSYATGATSASTVTNDGNWHHVVATNRNGTFQIYIDGTANGAAVTGMTPNISAPVNAGGVIGAATADALNSDRDYFVGGIDEVAVYNYALSPSQIQKHYTNSAWWMCQSLTRMSTSIWNFFELIYDGTLASVFVNGKKECTVQPGTTYDSTASSLTLGSTPAGGNYWSGQIQKVDIFGPAPAPSTAPITTETAQKDFDATANRVRTVPVEDIVTNGLVLHLDAANAVSGTRPPATPCSSSSSSWHDLSPSGLHGTLVNFSGCSGSGWAGAGTPANPYTLVFAGGAAGTASQHVVLPPISVDFSSQGITAEVWAQPDTPLGTWTRFFDFGTGQGNNNLLMALAQAGQLAFTLYAGTTTNDHVGNTGVYTTNTWNHFVATSTVSGTNYVSNLYVNGVLAATQKNLNIPPVITRTLNYIGKSNWSTDAYYKGKISIIRVYNKPFTLQQIKQNCLAQQGRFGVTSCAAP